MTEATTAPFAVVERSDLVPRCPHCNETLPEVYSRAKGVPLGQGRTQIVAQRHRPQAKGRVAHLPADRVGRRRQHERVLHPFGFQQQARHQIRGEERRVGRGGHDDRIEGGVFLPAVVAIADPRLGLCVTEAIQGLTGALAEWLDDRVPRRDSAVAIDG